MLDKDTALVAIAVDIIGIQRPLLKGITSVQHVVEDTVKHIYRNYHR